MSLGGFLAGGYFMILSNKISFLFYTGVIFIALSVVAYVDNSTEPTAHSSTIIYGADMREPVQCEFEEPLKYVTFINHWYDTNEEMYVDYITLSGDPDPEEEIWGWSNCIWEPKESWAACDMYLVKPEFVHADMYIDTMGHEALHASCGDFHD